MKRQTLKEGQVYTLAVGACVSSQSNKCADFILKKASSWSTKKIKSHASNTHSYGWKEPSESTFDLQQMDILYRYIHIFFKCLFKIDTSARVVFVCACLWGWEGVGGFHNLYILNQNQPKQTMATYKLQKSDF